MNTEVKSGLNYKYGYLVWPGFIFLLSLVVGTLSGLLIKNYNMFTHDVDGFGQLAAHFADHFNLDGSARRAPVYPVLLGFVYYIFGNYNQLAMIIFHSIFLGLIGLTAYYMAQKLYNDSVAPRFIALFLALNPILLWYIPFYFLEIVFAFFVLIAIWYAYLAFTNHKIKDAVLFGIFTGLTSLTKGIAILFPIYLLAIMLIIRILKPQWIDRADYKKIIRTGLISIIFLMVVIFPWTLRNKAVKGEWILISTNAGVEFFRGNVFAENNSYQLNKKLGPIFTEALQREDKLLKEMGMINPSETQLDSIFNPMMMDFITKQPELFTLKVIKQIPAFWTLSTNATTARIRFAIFIFTVIFFILGWKIRPTRFNLFVLFTIVYFNLMYAAIYACARYSFPLYPLMMISGGYFAYEMIKKILNRKRSAKLAKTLED